MTRQAHHFIGVAPVEESSRADSSHAPSGEDRDADAGETNEQKEERKPEFLLTLEDAYTQERREVQFSLSVSMLRGVETQRRIVRDGNSTKHETTRSHTRTLEYLLEMEYGLTDRLELDVGASYLDSREATDHEKAQQDRGFNGEALEIRYALAKEDARCPAVTASAGLIFPSQQLDRNNEWNSLGYSIGLQVSRDFGRWVGHVNLGYELTPDLRVQLIDGARPIEAARDAYEYGAAVVYKLSRPWHLILELNGNNEASWDFGKRVRKNDLSLVPGIRYGLESPKWGNLEMGAGFSVGVTEDAPDWGLLAKVQWEFRR